MGKHPANTLSLVADIGGTNTRVALADGVELLPDTVRRYSNATFPGLESVLRQFVIDEDNVDCKGAWCRRCRPCARRCWHHDQS